MTCLDPCLLHADCTQVTLDIRGELSLGGSHWEPRAVTYKQYLRRRIMLIPQVWVDLAEHDLAVSMPDAHHVILTGPSGERKYLLRIHTRPPGPAQVVQAAADASTQHLPGLLIAPKASPAAQHAALRAGLSLLLAPDSIGQLTRGHLVTPSGDLLNLAETTATPPRPGAPGQG